MKSNDAILTVCHRMPFNKLEPFVKSLELTSYTGRTVFFSSFLHSDTRKKLEACKVEIQPFHFLARHVRQSLAKPWSFWRRVFSLPLPSSLIDLLCYRVLHLFYLRHLLYLRFIEATPSIERVLMCDCRDVYFQKDPFSDWPGNGLHAFEEDRHLLIGDCPHHQRWVSLLAGKETLQRLGQLPRVCAGTIMADRDSALCFLRKMLELTYSARSLEPHDGDQGLYNILVHERLIPNISIHQNGQSSVLTVGGMPDEYLQTDADSYVIRSDQSRIPILHQYDRKPEITNPLLAKIGL
jgi:hypothetical protein